MPDKIEIWEPYLLSWEMIYELNVLQGGGNELSNLGLISFGCLLEEEARTDISHPELDPRNCIATAFPLSSVRNVKRRKHISAVQEWRSCQPQNALSICRWNCFRKMKNLQVLTYSLGVFFCFRSDEFDRLNVFFLRFLSINFMIFQRQILDLCGKK